MPGNRRGDAGIAMQCERSADIAAQRGPKREPERQDRAGIVNAPAAPDHDQDRECHQPMADANRQTVRLDSRSFHGHASKPWALSTVLPGGLSRKSTIARGFGRTDSCVTAIA